MAEIGSPSNTQISPIIILIGDSSSWLLMCTVTLSPLSLVYLQNTSLQNARTHQKVLHVSSADIAHELKDMQFVFLILGISVFSVAFRHVNCSMQMVTACQYILQPKTLCSLTSSMGGISEAQGLMNGTSLETDF